MPNGLRFPSWTSRRSLRRRKWQLEP